MSLFKCKMCGGTLEIQPNATVAECEYCGTTQTLPKLDDGRKANLFDRANHFRRNNEFDKAAGIYEQILNEDGSDAETYWSLVLCRYGIEYVEDPATHKRVPTVNRAQYTSIFDDDNYKSALQYADGYQRSIYEDEAKAINEIQKGILAISQKEEPFDVFICYKETDNSGRRTPDSVLATDLYHQLTQEGFKVFFSRITLEDKLGTAYEPYIFAALNSAKVMVVLGTKPEYFNAVWVKNEWSRYLALIKSGAKKLLIPAYKDMDPYDLPEEFSHLQAQDMSKLGFMQDLIRGVKKILAEDAPKSAAKESVVVNAGNANTAALMERVFMFLEDGDWQSADEYCERVLDADPKNAQAYLGKLMAELQVRKQENLKDCRYPFEKKNNYQKVLRFADQSLCEKLKGYVRYIEERNEHNRLENLYARAADRKAQANSEDAYKQAAEAFAEIPGYRDADSQKQECLELAESARKDAIYEHAMTAAKSHIIEDLEDAIKQLQTISGWRDADTKFAECQKKLEKLKADAEAERLEKARKAELEKKEAAERAKRNKKIAAIAIPAVALCIAIIIWMNATVIPNSKYKGALTLTENGRYDEAYEILVGLEGHNDAKEMLANFKAVYQTQREIDARTGRVTTREYSYDPAGNLLKEVRTEYDGDENIHEYSYDSAGNLVKDVWTDNNGNIITYEYSYDTAGNCINKSKVYSSGDKYTIEGYRYDAEGNRVETFEDWFGKERPIEQYEYDAEGNCVKKTHIEYDGKEIYYTYTDYSYDSFGNLIKWTDGFWEYEYTYDSAGKLIKEFVRTSNYRTGHTYEYIYDFAGNCIKETLVNSDGSKETITEFKYENPIVSYIPEEQIQTE